jgi:hypothetical protein
MAVSLYRQNQVPRSLSLMAVSYRSMLERGGQGEEANPAEAYCPLR